LTNKGFISFFLRGTGLLELVSDCNSISREKTVLNIHGRGQQQ